MHELQQSDKTVEDKLRVGRSAARLRVELRGEEGFRLVADSLVRPVVHVHKKRFPVGPQRIAVYRVAMILAGDKTLLRTDHAHRLVVAPVSVLQFINRRAACLCQQLVAHADTADGAVALQCLADMLYSRLAGIRVARPVGEEQPVVVQPVEVIVPRNTDDCHAPPEQAADNVRLHPD